MHFGTASRLLLSHDAVFVAALIDGLASAPGSEDSCRCPLNPALKRPTISASSPAMKVAASVQLLLSDQWLEDQALDGSPLGRLRPLLSGRRVEAQRLLTGLGLDGDLFEELAAEQRRLERDSTIETAAAAVPTANALARLMSQVGRLEGLPPEVQASLHELGRLTGIAIYALDTLEDLQPDLDRGAFNPNIDSQENTLCAQRVRRSCALLEETLGALQRQAAMLPWQRNLDLIDNILARGLAPRARRAIESAEHLVEGNARPRTRWQRWCRGIADAVVAPGRAAKRALQKRHRRLRDPQKTLLQNSCAVAPVQLSAAGPTPIPELVAVQFAASDRQPSESLDPVEEQKRRQRPWYKSCCDCDCPGGCGSKSDCCCCCCDDCCDCCECDC